MSLVPINRKRLARYSPEIQAIALEAGTMSRGMLMIDVNKWNRIISGVSATAPEPAKTLPVRPQQIEPCPRCGTPIVGRCGRRCNGCGYAPGCAD